MLVEDLALRFKYDWCTVIVILRTALFSETSLHSTGRWHQNQAHHHQNLVAHQPACQHISSSSSVAHWPTGRRILTWVWSRRPTIFALSPTSAFRKRPVPTFKKTLPGWKTWASKAWSMRSWWRSWRGACATRRSGGSAVRQSKYYQLFLRRETSVAGKFL